MRRGFPEAPSGAGQISADRANRTGFRREGLRGAAGSEGNMFGGGSSVIFDGAKIRFFGNNLLYEIRGGEHYSYMGAHFLETDLKKQCPSIILKSADIC